MRGIKERCTPLRSATTASCAAIWGTSDSFSDAHCARFCSALASIFSSSTTPCERRARTASVQPRAAATLPRVSPGLPAASSSVRTCWYESAFALSSFRAALPASTHVFGHNLTPLYSSDPSQQSACKRVRRVQRGRRKIQWRSPLVCSLSPGAPQMPSFTRDEKSVVGMCPLFRQKKWLFGQAEVPAGPAQRTFRNGPLFLRDFPIERVRLPAHQARPFRRSSRRSRR